MELRSVADQPQTGAMIALVPSEDDAQRLIVPGGEMPDDLHVTLCYWADAEALGNPVLLDMHRAAISIASNFPAIMGEAFGFAVFNPGEEACTVLEINGDDIALVRMGLVEMTGPGDTKSPWNAHMTLKYGSVPNATLADRLGPITFTHIRVAVGDGYTEYPLSGEPYIPEGPQAENLLMALAESEPTATDVTENYVASDCGCDDEEDDYPALMASVNTKTWSSLPVADRETPWSADEAIARISTWAGGNGNKFGSPFLWKAKDGQPLNPESYRLPIADIINGRMVLIPRAVFSAGTILSGGHGYLEGVVTDAERDALKATVTEIYAMLQEKYQDPRVVAPWLRGRTPDEREQEASNMTSAIIAAVNSSGWPSMPIADAGHGWDGDGARGRVRSWADGDMRKYRRAFLWWDSNNPENFSSYKLPIADILDGTLTIIPKAVSSALGAINGARGGVAIPDSDMAQVRGILEGIQKRVDGGNTRTASATTAVPVAPPAEWFEDPKLTKLTPLTVTADGRVFGHLAAWNVCHMGIANKCVLAPRSVTNYKYFANGDVLTSDGSMVRVGRLTVGTGHADVRLGWVPAADHYDNTGTAAAIVVPREDKFGINVAGGAVADASPEQIAALRRSPLSGDWRRTPEGNLELVAALAVNTPGFPIIASGADGVQSSLVAAGLVLPEGVQMPPEPVEDFDMTSRLDEIIKKVDRALGAQRARAFHAALSKIKG
jgi:hypothetical protein